MDRQSTSDIAKDLALRAEQPDDVTPKEYRRLFIKGLAALLREVDSIAFTMRDHIRRGGR